MPEPNAARPPGKELSNDNDSYDLLSMVSQTLPYKPLYYHYFTDEKLRLRERRKRRCE